MAKNYFPECFREEEVGETWQEKKKCLKKYNGEFVIVQNKKISFLGVVDTNRGDEHQYGLKLCSLAFIEVGDDKRGYKKRDPSKDERFFQYDNLEKLLVAN